MIQGTRLPLGRKTPLGLLGMAVLVVAIEIFLARNPLDFGLPDQGEWSHGARAAKTRSRGCEILCFGDSLVKCGLQPRVISERLGRKTYNLAVSASPAASSYYLFRQALNAGARPRAVVVDFEPSLMAVPPKDSPFWGEMLGPGECLHLSWVTRDLVVLVSTLLDRYVPSVAGRHVIRSCVGETLNGRGPNYGSSRRGDCFTKWRNWNTNDGAFVALNGPDTREELAPIFQRFVILRPWDPVQREYIHRFCRLASERGIAVFWLIPPLQPVLEARRDESGFSAQFDREVGEVQSRFPGVTVLDARRSGYVPSAFADPVHLARRGALALSADVAAELSRLFAGAPAGPRRVKLPDFAGRPDDPRFENYLQSMTALKTLTPVRR